MKTKLLFLAFLISVLSWGQVTIFEYTNTTATIPSGWNLTNGAGSNNIDQTTYLEDKSLGVIHDLRQNPYSFTGTSGILNDRFVLRYTNETLGNEDFENNSDVLIFSSDLINIQSFNQTIQSVTIHNVLGQLLVNELNVNSDKLEIKSLQKNKAPLIVQVTLENGKKIVKKLIF